MFVMEADEVRKNWRAVLDTVCRDKPVFVRRGRDTALLMDTAAAARLVADLRFSAAAYRESNGSVTLSLDDIDLAVNEKTLAAAKKALAAAIADYAQDYYDDFAACSRAPNRRAHLPYVFKAWCACSQEELADAIVCHEGQA